MAFSSTFSLRLQKSRRKLNLEYLEPRRHSLQSELIQKSQARFFPVRGSDFNELFRPVVDKMKEPARGILLAFASLAANDDKAATVKLVAHSFTEINLFNFLLHNLVILCVLESSR
jgi:hypothetical protein